MQSGRRRDPKVLQNVRCRTFKDVDRLSLSDLNSFCCSCGIDVDLPKSVKVNAVCHCLGISTTGTDSITASPRVCEGLTIAQRQEFESLTPLALYLITDWTNNLTKVPAIDDNDVKKYLLQTNLLDKTAMRTYKVTRPYQLKPFIHSVKFHDMPTSDCFCIVKALCNPSQSTSKDDMKLLHVIINKHTGQPYGGYCTCTAGYCQSCGHIGAALFCLSELIATGVSEMPDQPSCTELLCKWTDPKAADAKPATLQEVQERKTGSKISRFYLKSDQSPSPAVDYAEVAELRSKLLNATVDEGCCVPAVHALAGERFTSPTAPTPVTTMPDFALDLENSDIVYSEEIEVHSYPTPVAFLPHVSFSSVNSSPDFVAEKERFIASINYPQSQLDQIRLITVGQSNNIEWFRQRMGSLTASHFGSISRFMSSGRVFPKSILQQIQNYAVRSQNSPPKAYAAPLKWGLNNEKNGRKSYESAMRSSHSGLKVELTGLVVNKNHPFLRASPDGIVSCHCHASQWLLEVKCPWSVRHLDPLVAVEQGLLKYVQKSEDQYCLVPGDPLGYYEQVQGTMGILGMASCDFVVWTPLGTLVMCVNFDEQFWSNSLKPQLIQFFEDYVVPEILTEQLRCELVQEDELSQAKSDEESELQELLQFCIAYEQNVSEPVSKATNNVCDIEMEETDAEGVVEVEEFMWEEIC